jgi:hypothetical protein
VAQFIAFKKSFVVDFSVPFVNRATAKFSAEADICQYGSFCDFPNQAMPDGYMCVVLCQNFE